MTKIDFISKDAEYFLRISYMDEFIGIIENGNRILKRNINEKLFDHIIDNIESVYINTNNVRIDTHAIDFSKQDKNIFYNLTVLDYEEISNCTWMEKLFIEIVVNKKVFVKLKLRYS